MEVGHVVRFSSQKYPFLVETTPCLDLDCSCSIMKLALVEVQPGAPPRDRLTFTLRVCLKTWAEHDPPPRSLEVESLAHEFMARFPTERINELVEEFTLTRMVKRRLQSLSLTGSPDELVTYSSLIHEAGGIGEGLTDASFFFVFEGREFLVEDHYCANPECDCQEVHVEFWERKCESFPKRRIQVEQRLMVILSLEGKLNETCFSRESASMAKYLLLAWRRRCDDQLQEFRRRYELIKAIGARSFPAHATTKLRTDTIPAAQPKTTLKIDLRPPAQPERRGPEPQPSSRIGRNDPCPCGSGLKFKRCCARRHTVSEPGR